MILKNKYFVGQEVYDGKYLETVTIDKIERDTNYCKLMYRIKTNFEAWRDESTLYESKEAYEAECNQIKVEDKFYLLASNGDRLKVFYKTALDIGTFHISVGEEDERYNKSFCFKTPELLLEAVAKAVKEIKE